MRTLEQYTLVKTRKSAEFVSHQVRMLVRLSKRLELSYSIEECQHCCSSQDPLPLKNMPCQFQHQANRDSWVNNYREKKTDFQRCQPAYPVNTHHIHLSPHIGHKIPQKVVGFRNKILINNMNINTSLSIGALLKMNEVSIRFKVAGSQPHGCSHIM